MLEKEDQIIKKDLVEKGKQETEEDTVDIKSLIFIDGIT